MNAPGYIGAESGGAPKLIWPGLFCLGADLKVSAAASLASSRCNLGCTSLELVGGSHVAVCCAGVRLVLIILAASLCPC